MVITMQFFEIFFIVLFSFVRSVQRLRDEAAGFLLEEAFLDLEPHFQDLISRKWVTSTAPIDTIETTLVDYFQVHVIIYLSSINESSDNDESDYQVFF